MQVRFGISRDGQNLSVGQRCFIQKCFQLSKLSGAVGSPITPVENKHHIRFASKARKCDRVAVFGRERKIRRRISHTHLLEICSQQVESVFGTQLLRQSQDAARGWEES